MKGYLYEIFLKQINIPMLFVDITSLCYRFLGAFKS
jgi:hypothetical protein